MQTQHLMQHHPPPRGERLRPWQRRDRALVASTNSSTTHSSTCTSTSVIICSRASCRQAWWPQGSSPRRRRALPAAHAHQNPAGVAAEAGEQQHRELLLQLLALARGSSDRLRAALLPADGQSFRRGGRRRRRLPEQWAERALGLPFLFFLQDLEQALRRQPGGAHVTWPAPPPPPFQQQQQRQRQPRSEWPAEGQAGQGDASPGPLEGQGFVLLSHPDQQPQREDEEEEEEEEQGEEDAPQFAAPGVEVEVEVRADDVAWLAAELVALREWQEQEAARRLLPSLASSLAYDNLTRWRQEAGLPRGTQLRFTPQQQQEQEGGRGQGGIPLEQLYRFSEEQERQLGGSGAGAGQAGREAGALEGFARRPGNEVFASVAAGAVARMRARFQGFEDSALLPLGGVPPLQAAVLDTLLWSCVGGLGERAELLHQACDPPGLPYHPPPSTVAEAGAPPPADPAGPPHAHAAPGPAGLTAGASAAALEAQRRAAQRLGAYASTRPSALHSSAPSSSSSSSSSFFSSARSWAPCPASPADPPPPQTGGEAAPQAAGADHAPRPPGWVPPGTRVCTTPQALQAEIRSRLLDSSASPAAPLPCGTPMRLALEELQGVVEDYERHVWRS